MTNRLHFTLTIVLLIAVFFMGFFTQLKWNQFEREAREGLERDNLSAIERKSISDKVQFVSGELSAIKSMRCGLTNDKK